MFSNEFEGNKVLQGALSALVFVYFVAFMEWIRNPVITIDAVKNFSHQCPPYFQSCESFYFLRALPDGYSQTLFYMLLFALLTWCAYLLTERKWREAQLLLIPAFFWHVSNVLFLTDKASGNYEYYIVVFGTVILFLPHKEFFAKLAFVSLYVLSTIVKIHPAWIEGGYFNSLQLGLPLLPYWFIPIASNVVILMEMAGAWFLLSKNKYLQRGALFFFIFFHLYSGILVEYRYPATVVPMLLVLFGPWYKYSNIPLTKKSIISWFFIMLLFLIQFSSLLISGDAKLTLEGNKYGLYMFESNHQCISTESTYLDDGTMQEKVRTSASARSRCNPYTYWFTLKQYCEKKENVDRIAWTFDHSINGDPFLRIVDEQNVCNLEYKPFSHNDWIKRHSDNPEIIGTPARNVFY